MLTSFRSAVGGFLLALIAALPAHAQTGTAKPKATLNSEIGQQLPDNTSNLITPLNARTVNVDLVASFQQAPQVNLQTGTTYTVLASDYGQVVRFNNSSPIAVTIPQATGTFSVFSVYINQIGTGTVTVTPASGTIDGGANFALQQNQNILVVSDGTNWQVLRSTPGVASIAGTSGSFLLNGDLAIITGTTSTNGPYTAGATTITVTSLKGMSVGQSITLHYDDTTTQTVTTTALGNSQLGATVTFTPAISGGKTLSATDQVTWSQVLALNSNYFPVYDPSGFGAASTGHNIPWLDNDNNQFTGNSLGMTSSDYSIDGSISIFCATTLTSCGGTASAVANGDTTTVVIGKGSGIVAAAASTGATQILVASADDLSTLTGQQITIHLNSGTQTVTVASVTGASAPFTVSFSPTTLTGNVAAGNLVDLPIPNFSFQAATVATTTGTNPSSVTVNSSIKIPAGDTVYLTTSSPSATFTTTVSSMTPVGGCNPGSAPCAWTLNFSPAVNNGGTLNSGNAVYWNYTYSASFAAVVPSDTMFTYMRRIANAINADSRIAASGTQAVIQGLSASTATLIIEPKRFGPLRPVPGIAIFESPGGANHLQLSSTSQPLNILDASSILNLSRAATGYQPKAGDAVGFLQFSGITDDGSWLCCTAQYSSIISFISNPTPGANLLGTLAFYTAGSLGVNRRFDLNKGIAFYTDAGVIAAGGDQGGGTINLPATGGYFVGGTAGISCPGGVTGANTRVVKGIVTVC